MHGPAKIGSLLTDLEVSAVGQIGSFAKECLVKLVKDGAPITDGPSLRLLTKMGLIISADSVPGEVEQMVRDRFKINDTVDAGAA